MESNKAELTFDEIKNGNDIPTLKTINSTPYEKTDFSAGTIDETSLSAEERQLVDQMAEKIDVDNVEQLANYGFDAQTNISDFSVSILKQVKTLDLGDVGDSLRDLTIALDATIEPEKKGIRGLFQKAKLGVNTIRANYAKAESNVDRIEKDLQQHRLVLTQDISMYQKMFDLNLEYYKELTMYIIAGKKALAKAQTQKLLELKAKADNSNKQEDVQSYRDYEDLCHRFEKRLADLEITRMISIQSAPQVRMLQNNDRELLDKLQSSLANTIPLWRNQLVLSLGIEHTSRALSAQGRLTDKTNELLAKNSERLKLATIETAKQSERAIVDISVLQQCNKDLITSINEVIRIHEEGTSQRMKAQEELLKIEEDLKEALRTVGQ